MIGTLFRYGGIIGAGLRHFKMMMILVAVIAVISYLQATRMDAKKAAAASVEIENLVRISQIKDRQLKIQSRLTEKYQQQSAGDRVKIDAAKDAANQAFLRIGEMSIDGEGMICAIDCRVP